MTRHVTSGDGGEPDAAAPSSTLRRGFFREDALRHHLGRREFGDVLRLPPLWTRLAFPLILAFVAAALAYLCMGTVARYVHGTGIVRSDGGDGRFVLVALFPGEARPRLRPGMRVRVELSSDPSRALWTTIESIDDRVVGPAEARRILGPAADHALAIDAPVVFARAALRGNSGTDRGNDVVLHDRMSAKVEAPMSRERLLYALVPGIKQALGS